MSAAVDVRAVLERMASQAESHRETTSLSYPALQRVYEEDRDALAAVAELVAADRAVDEAESAMTRYHMAGPRHGGGYGTPWEARDEAIKRDLEAALKAAHTRRAAALARVGGAS